jgi:GNAT superfamily N-acetyltransferase
MMPDQIHDISLVTVNEKKALKTFIYLPAGLYRDQPNWVPPIYVDEWKFHDPSQNPSLQYADVIRFLAYRNNQPVGRVMGIINNKYNEAHGEHTARFFQFDLVNNENVAKVLLNAIIQWAKEKGMSRLIGPYGFSDKDPQGLQIEGFEHLPVIATPTNPSYIPQLVEGLGFTKHLDCVSYQLAVPEQIPELYERISERTLRNMQIKVLNFTSKREMKPYIVPVFRLVNETYAPLFGFVPMSEKEMKRMAAQYMPVLDPAFVKCVLNDMGELIAFIVGIPDMSAGIRKAKGKLFPFGFLYMLAAARKTKQLDLMLGAIRQDYRGRGLNALLGTELMRAASKRGFDVMDSHLVLEENGLMCAEYEKMGVKYINGIAFMARNYKVPAFCSP